MVLAEIPLWVSHGNPSPSAADSGGARTLPGIGFPKPNASASGGGGVAVPSINGGTTTPTANSNQTEQYSLDKTSAKSAISLLTSTRSGGGSKRAPMYSIDVHPDGTRFATAAGDGTVKIWSTACLFGGKFMDEEEKGGSEVGGKKKRRSGARGASSKFTEGGNFVSSNSEDYDESSSSSSSSEEERGDGVGRGVSPASAAVQSQPQQQQPGTPQAGVNDLSGLVRKKKGGRATPAAPLSGNKDGPLSPLSRLTQQQQPDTAAAATAATSSLTSVTNNGDKVNNSLENPIKSKASSSQPTSQDFINHKKKQQHKLLTTISSHEGSVLSLRFSPSGTYLATSGDDSYVNIYVRSNVASLAKGNLVGVGNDIGGGADGGGGTAGSEDIEHWNRIAICRGHHLDVVGLAWAPDDSHLVSCSLDSVHPVIVWKLYDVLGNTTTDANNNGNGATSGGGVGGMGNTMMSNLNPSSVHIHNLHPFKVLGRDVHTSTVKGVAFDPAGKYLATSGDDPAICIWRASEDWGLEARIDSSSGVFRSKKRKQRAAGEGVVEEEEDDPGELASLSLFRRISFAPDGSHVCGTNATLQHKNIAAMISREGWMASGPRDCRKASVDGSNGEPQANRPPPGAANLVGHKQPVVASRHCPVFFDVPKKKKSSRRKGSGSSSSSSEESEESDDDDDDPDEVPEYATLVALGDKRGFVTVWSTKSSRPLFKMQCSESRCTVTDISWGLVRNKGSSSHSSKDGSGDGGGGKDSLIMIVSLLDGYIVALHFDIPTEVGGGAILSSEKTSRIFKLKYGIDDFVGSYGFSPCNKRRGGARKRLVDDAGPMLIENALQLTMEMEAEAAAGEDSEEEMDENDGGEEDVAQSAKRALSADGSNAPNTGSGNIKDKQVEQTTKGGKKRIRPVLMNSTGGGGGAVTNVSDEDGTEKQAAGKKRQKKNKEQSSDPLQNALDAASRAASAAEAVSSQAGNQAGGKVVGSEDAAGVNVRQSTSIPGVAAVESHVTSMGPTVWIPFHTNRILSVDLASKSPDSTAIPLSSMDEIAASTKIVADCTNSTTSSSSAATASQWPCITLTISQSGVRKWKDIIFKSKATAMAANHDLLSVGTSDGALYLYGTSPTLGWGSCKAYRAYPPFIFGSPVVEISIGGGSGGARLNCAQTDMVVVTSDGNFYVYSLLATGPKLNYKGSIIPAMEHMRLSSVNNQQCSSAQPKMARIQISDSNQLMLILVMQTKSTGRSLQGFIYDCNMELWMRISDSNNFVLSDFYSSLSSQTTLGAEGDNNNVGMLAKMDRFVQSGASSTASAKQMYQKVASSESKGSDSHNIVTRSHCEDRLACSIALGSSSEFQTWLRYYARCLVSMGEGGALRFLVDIILGGGDEQDSSSSSNVPSFLSAGEQTLGLESKDLVRKLVLPEMSKNRLLQRLTNEISMEIDSL